MRISDWSSDVCSSDLWSENYFRLLLDYEYELVKSPAGAQQWQPVNQKEEDMAPAAHDPSKKVPTMMTTADMALKVDPEFRKISEKVRSEHEAFKADVEIGRATCRERGCE